MTSNLLHQVFELSTFRPVTSEDVKSVIMSSRTKSWSLDPIPTVLVKKCIDVFVCPITAVINSSLMTGIFLSQFKHGLVTLSSKRKILILSFSRTIVPLQICPSYRKQQNVSYLISCISICKLMSSMLECRLITGLTSVQKRHYSMSIMISAWH